MPAPDESRAAERGLDADARVPSYDYGSRLDTVTDPTPGTPHSA